MIEEEVFGLQVSVDDVEFMDILDSSNNLVKELAGFLLFDSVVLDNVFKELSSACILHDEVELPGGFDDLEVRQ